MRRAVAGARARARAPRVAHETLLGIQLAFRQDFPRADTWPPDDQLQHAFVLGCLADRLETRFELRRRQLFDSGRVQHGGYYGPGEGRLSVMRLPTRILYPLRDRINH